MILNEQDIINITNFLRDSLKSFKDFTDIDWSSVYKETVSLADRIKVHTDYDVKPVSLLKDGYAGEEKAELNYRLNNYKNRTMPMWDKAIGETKIIYNSKWSVDWSQTNEPYSEDLPENYFTNEYPLYGNFFSYFQNVLHDEKFKDPNAVVAIEPYTIPIIETADVVVADQSKRIEPYCVIYRSESVIQYVRNSHLLVKTELTSKVKDGSTTVKGLVFKLFDSENIWLIEQVGNKRDYDFNISLFYNHSLGYLPAQQLLGTICYRNDNIVYLSYFFNAVAGLDIALQQYSTLDLIIKKHAYPIKAYVYEDCGECAGTGIDELNETSCTSCAGTGRLNNLSPLKDIQHRLSDRNNPDEQTIFPGLQFIAPDTKVIEFLESNTRRTVEDAFLTLNIDITNKPNGQTATEKKIDLQSRHTFYITFTNELFNTMDFLINTIGLMRYSITSNGSLNTKWVKPIVNKPIEFSMTSTADLIEELKLAKDGNLPDISLMEITKEHLRQRYPNNERLSKTLDIIFYADSLATKSSKDIAILNSLGAFPKWKLVLHSEIHTLIKTKPEYMEMELEDIAQDLKQRVLSTIPAEPEDILLDI